MPLILVKDVPVSKNLPDEERIVDRLSSVINELAQAFNEANNAMNNLRTDVKMTVAEWKKLPAQVEKK